MTTAPVRVAGSPAITGRAKPIYELNLMGFESPLKYVSALKVVCRVTKVHFHEI